MVCKADTRFILVRAERPYFQCSLLLVLLCTEVLVVEGYKLVERDSSQVFVCGCVRVFKCLLSTLPLLGVVQRVLSRVHSSPFIVCKGRGRITISGLTKIERKCNTSGVTSRLAPCLKSKRNYHNKFSRFTILPPRK
jgi:hypothetical protein